MLKCKYCGTGERKDGRPFEKQGQLNLHEYHCKMKNSKQSNNQQQQEEKQERQHVHKWRFLTVSSPIERKAYNSGFKEVCVECQELR